MNGERYYSYQAKARGLFSVKDVEALVHLATPVYRSLLSDWLPADRNASIYEVACGPGIMLHYLREEGYSNVSGSDSSVSQIDLARAAGLSAKLADSLIELQQQPAETWTCLIAIDFIEHLPKDVLVDFLAQAQRTLKPGGCLILRAPNGDSPFVGLNLFNDITHYWAYTTVATHALMKMAGFTSVEFRDESLASVQHHRWLKVPLMRFSRALLRGAIRSVIRERLEFLSPSIFVGARK